MPSTYTLNNGIELIATGEQSGTWGDTTNTNMSLLDTALDGQVTVTLASAGTSGSPNTLPISDGAASNGRNRLVEFNDGADLGATAYVQLTPNDAEKIMYIRNSLSGSRSIIVFQGTYSASNDYEIPAGKTAVIFFNGAGTGAVAANVFNNAHIDALNTVGGAAIGTTLTVGTSLNIASSTTVDGVLDEDNMASDSATKLATQQSIKAYVDAQVTAQDLDFAGDSGTGAVDLDSQSFTVAGTANEIETAASGQTLTVGLPASVTVTTSLTTPTIKASNIDANDGTAAINIADSTGAVDIDTSLNVDGSITGDGLTIDGVGVIDMGTSAGTGLTIQSDNDAAVVGPHLKLYSGRSNTASYNMLTVSNSSGNLMILDGRGGMTLTPSANGAVIFNESGADADFRVESDSNTHMLFVDASSNRVAIGHGSPTSALDVKSTSSNIATFYGDSANIAYLDITNYGTSGTNVGAGIELRANSDVQERQVGYINSVWTDNTDATRDSVMQLYNNKNGSNNVALKLGADSTVFNEGGLDVDFRVESDSDPYALFVDAGRSVVGLGTSVNQNWNTAVNGVQIGASGSMYSSSTSQINLMANAYYGASGFHYLNADEASAYIQVGGAHTFYVAGTGAAADDAITWTTALGIDNGGKVVINEGGIDADFRVESQNHSDMFFVDASVDQIGIKTSALTETLNIDGNFAFTEGDWVGFDVNSSLLFRDDNLGVTVNSMALRSTNDLVIATMSNAAGSGNIYIGKNDLDPSGASWVTNFILAEDGSVTLNESGADANLRVESSLNDGALFVDGGNSRVGINDTTPDATLDIVNTGADDFTLRIDAGSNYQGLNFAGSATYGNGTVQVTNITTPGSGTANATTWFKNNGTVGSGGATRHHVRIDGGLVANNGEDGSGDFTAKSTNQSHMLYVDSGNDTVVIGDGISTDCTLNVGVSTQTIAMRIGGALTGSDGIDKYIRFQSKTSGSANRYADIKLNVTTEALELYNAKSSGPTHVGISLPTDNSVVINEQSDNADFRVESDGNSHMIFVDASEDKVGIGYNSPQSQLDVKGRVTFRGTTNEGVMSSFADSCTYTTSTSSTDIFQIYGLSNTSAEITVVFSDGSYRNGSFIQKLYVSTNGSGSTVSAVDLVVEDKSRRNSGTFPSHFTWTATASGSYVVFAATADQTISGDGTIAVHVQSIPNADAFLTMLL